MLKQIEQYSGLKYKDGQLYRNGILATYLNKGILYVCINRKPIQAKRVIWEMHNGPTTNKLRTKNNNRFDLRIENLQEVGRGVPETHETTDGKLVDSKGFLVLSRDQSVTYIRYSRTSKKWYLLEQTGKFQLNDYPTYLEAKKALKRNLESYIRWSETNSEI